MKLLTRQRAGNDGAVHDSDELDEGAEPTSNADSDEHGEDETAVSQNDQPPRRIRDRFTPQRLALLVGLLLVAALGALSAWLGLGAYHAHQAADQRALFLQAGRQGAVNLTTIDWQNADTDVDRIIDSATGTFAADFAQRSQPFIEVVKQAKSKSQGTVTMAGIESETADSAKVLVGVSVVTSMDGTPQPDPRRWRLRLTVEKAGDDVRVSNVEFLP